MELIIEKQSVWEHLQQTKKPVVLYGMGDGALKIMKVLEHYQVPVAAIFASDGFVRGHSFAGFPVLSLAQVEEQFDDFIVLMAFAIHDDETTARIHQIAQRHEFYAPDVPVAGENLFTIEFYRQHQEKFMQVYQLLADNWSRTVYRDILNFKLSGKLCYLTHCQTTVEEAYHTILQPNQNEIFADLGAYKGDTIEELFRFTQGHCQRVLAMEPDRKNFKKLCATAQRLGLPAESCYNVAAYSKEGTMLFSNKAGRQSALCTSQGVETPVNSLDNLLAGQPVTFINMDVEGGEKQAIEGCARSIAQYKPKLLIAAYHRSEDLFALPLQIHKIRPDYRFYFRHYQYIPAWDTNLYCV